MSGPSEEMQAAFPAKEENKVDEQGVVHDLLSMTIIYPQWATLYTKAADEITNLREALAAEKIGSKVMSAPAKLSEGALGLQALLDGVLSAQSRTGVALTTDAICAAIVTKLGITPEMVELVKGPTVACEDDGFTVPCTSAEDLCQCHRLNKAADALATLLEVAGQCQQA